MFKIKGTTIHLTRGDVATLSVNAQNNDGSDYIFQEGDVVRLSVYKARDCNCIEIEKDVEVESASKSVDIELAPEDTAIGGVINKPVTYWYEIELNPDTNPQTIVGYDEEGAKMLILYPESGGGNE